jgi:sugar lactone lactonase YvrE
MKSLLRIALTCLYLLQLSLIGFAQSGIISTFAGYGTRGFGGDGASATSASLNEPSGVAVDAAGNLYIADTYNHRIRKVASDGTIRTVAGTGTAGFSGDGGPAVSAQLNLPYGMAIDAAGNLYIADSENCRIRKLTPDGIIRTVAGSGTAGFNGDGYIATSAQLRYPHGVAVDAAGNLFIADGANNRVRKVTPDGIIRTVAGTGSYGFSGDGGPAVSALLYYPAGLVIDAAGNLLIADASNNRIRKLTPDGIINTVAGNGSNGFGGDGSIATSAQLYFPASVALDAAGNLYIADEINNCIRKVASNGIISTVAGNGSYGFSGDGGLATSAMLWNPSSVAIDAIGNLLIADPGNNRIRMAARVGSYNTYFPQVAVGDGWSTSFTLSNTASTAFSGNLILSDSQGNPLTVKSSSLGAASSFPISIPSAGTLFLDVNPLSSGDPAKRGWAKVESTGGSLEGVASYQSAFQGTIQNAAGVLSSQLIQFATIQVDDESSQGRSTAYAIANPTDQILAVKVALVDSDGVVVDDTIILTLNPGQQIARYFNQDFPNRPTFQGVMVLRAQGAGTFIAVALVQDGKLFTAIPVMPGKPPNIPH